MPISTVQFHQKKNSTRKLCGKWGRQTKGLCICCSSWIAPWLCPSLSCGGQSRRAVEDDKAAIVDKLIVGCADTGVVADQHSTGSCSKGLTSDNRSKRAYLHYL
jgi:hypothetical protein